MFFVNGIPFNTESIKIGPNHVGYIFRKEKTVKNGEEQDWGHAGCILPHGRIVAFGFSPVSFAQATLDANTRVGEFKVEKEKGIQGDVKFYDQMPKPYTDVKTAIRMGFQSHVLIIK